jgi:hypothetical protein
MSRESQLMGWRRALLVFQRAILLLVKDREKRQQMSLTYIVEVANQLCIFVQHFLLEGAQLWLVFVCMTPWIH